MRPTATTCCAPAGPPAATLGTLPRDDAHGSMIQMPHLVEMAWDYRDQLRMSRRQAADPAAAERTWYVYDASGERVRKATDRCQWFPQE